MAQRPDLDLGSVGFGLEANTEALQRALGVLTQFGEKVNKLSDQSFEFNQIWYKHFANVEKVLTNTQSRVQVLADKLRSLGDTKGADKLITDFERLNKTLTSQTYDLKPHELQRGISGINAIMARANTEAQNLANQRKAGIQQAVAMADNEARDRRRGLEQIAANNEDERRLRNAGVVQYRAIEENERRVRAQGLLQARAQAENDRRERMRGVEQFRASQENDARTRSQGIMQFRALAENEARTRQLGLAQIRATRDNEQRERSIGLQMVAAQQEDERRTRQRGIQMANAQAEDLRRSEQRLGQIARQERTVNALGVRARAIGFRGESLEQAREAFTGYAQSVQGGNFAQQTAALTLLQQRLAALRLDLSEAGKGSTFMANAMRDLSAASVLALGPLSGAGSRLAVMSHLMQTGGMQTAIMVAGITSVAVAFGALATAGVKATMSMEKYNALLTSAAGSSALAGQEFDYIRAQADRFGQSLEAVVAPYAKFATAARLSGMSLMEQRNIFESVMTAGAALRMDNQKLERTFLALEQMISKGKVSREELRQQLGEAIPGAMSIMAFALGKSTSELDKMMQKGEVMSRDALPKFADALNKMFGAGALEGARTLQAEFNRLSTALFMFNKAFDEQIHTSELVRTAVIALSNALNAMSGNMGQVLAVGAGLAGAFAGYLGAATILASAGAVIRLGTAFTTLWASIAAGGAVLTTLGGVLGLAVRLGLVIGGATLAYNHFNQELDTTVKRGQEFNDKAKVWVQSVQEIGFAHKRTYDQMKAETQTRLQMVDAEIKQQMILMEALALGDRFRKDQEKKELGPTPRDPLQAQRRAVREATIDAKQDPNIAAAEARMKALRDVQEQYAMLLKSMGSMKIKDFNDANKPGQDAEKGLRGFDNWIRGIEKVIRENDLLARQLAGGEVSKHAEAMTRALEESGNAMAALEGMDKKRSLQPLEQALLSAGYAGANLREQLTNLFYGREMSQNRLREMTETVKNFEQAALKAGDMISEDLARRRAAEHVIAGGDPDELTYQRRRENALKDYRATLLITTRNQEAMNAALAAFGAQMDETRSVEQQAERLKDLRKEMDRLADSIGDKSARAWFDYEKGVQRVNEALAKNVISQEQANRFVATLNQDLYRKLWEDADDWVKETTRQLQRVGDVASETFTGIFFDGEFNFKRLVDTVGRDVANMVTKMLVMKPLMTYLFGDLYTGGTGRDAVGGVGALGGWMSRMFGLSYPGMGAGLGSGAGGGLFGFGASDLGMVNAAVGHQGANIGNSANMRNLPGWLWQGAPRHHKGTSWLGADEVPFIGLRGEQVVAKGASAGGRAIQISQSFTINMPQGTSSGDPNRDATAMASILMPLVEAKTVEVLQREMNPGGALNPV
jgi:tape measure domain-containing protein